VADEITPNHQRNQFRTVVRILQNLSDAHNVLSLSRKEASEYGFAVYDMDLVTGKPEDNGPCFRFPCPPETLDLLWRRHVVLEEDIPQEKRYKVEEQSTLVNLTFAMAPEEIAYYRLLGLPQEENHSYHILRELRLAVSDRGMEQYLGYHTSYFARS
jgi:hypothetical protein